MTIEFRDVTKKVRLGPTRVTYENLNIRLEEKAHIAFLGQKDAGLEAIINLICQSDAPDSGVITRSHSVSWAIPDSKYIHKHHPLVGSARFIARLYEADEKAYVAKVSEMGELGDFINIRGDMCPKDVFARFVFYTGICLPFDQYILTNVSVGGKAGRERVAEVIGDMKDRAGLLLATADIKSAKMYCDQAYVFHEGSATYFDDMEAAAEFFGSIASAGGGDDDFFDPEPELEDLVNVDF
jgi:ABC-type polysaccharide/polyol phosphate transport system ATPase subunit